MSDSGQECPFLNRPDLRCDGYFSLERLKYAFAHCLGDYESCPLYGLLLLEQVAGRDRADVMCDDEYSHAGPSLTPITITCHIHKSLAGAA